QNVRHEDGDGSRRPAPSGRSARLGRKGGRGARAQAAQGGRPHPSAGAHRRRAAGLSRTRQERVGRPTSREEVERDRLRVARPPMIYLDTGCLLKLYYPEPESARVARLVGASPIAFIALHELELSNALELKLFRRDARAPQVAATH